MRKSSQSGLRSQDILLLLKLIASNAPRARQIDLAISLHLSQGEVAYSLDRLLRAGLIDESKKKVQKLAAIELLNHALKYFFPPEFGSYVRGIPTGHSVFSLKKKLVAEEAWVWPDPDGEVRGLSLAPLYASAPFAAKNDPKLYELLALVDSIRAGNSRERKLAEVELNKLILKKTK